MRQTWQSTNDELRPSSDGSWWNCVALSSTPSSPVVPRHPRRPPSSPSSPVVPRRPGSSPVVPRASPAAHHHDDPTRSLQAPSRASGPSPGRGMITAEVQIQKNESESRDLSDYESDYEMPGDARSKPPVLTISKQKPTVLKKVLNMTKRGHCRCNVSDRSYLLQLAHPSPTLF
jgi:hypothetical protein